MLSTAGKSSQEVHRYKPRSTPSYDRRRARTMAARVGRKRSGSDLVRIGLGIMIASVFGLWLIGMNGLTLLFIAFTRASDEGMNLNAWNDLGMLAGANTCAALTLISAMGAGRRFWVIAICLLICVVCASGGWLVYEYLVPVQDWPLSSHMHKPGSMWSGFAPVMIAFTVAALVFPPRRPE